MSPAKESERFLEKYYVCYKQELADKLDGPFVIQNVLSPNSLQAKKNGKQFTIILRGCTASGVKDVDLWARKSLGTIRFEEIYLLRDSIIKQDENTIKGVIYVPAHRVFLGKNDAGESLFDNQTYTLRHLTLLVQGYCLLDRSDTNCPLYDIFLKAENLAKKERRGYWKHRELFESSTGDPSKVAVSIGDQNLKANETHSCQVIVGNRAEGNVLRSVVIDSKGLRLEFGYLGKGSPKNLKGAGGQEIRFAADFAISWEEDGMARETMVNIKQYEKKKNQIKSFSFFYLGNMKWKIVAQDDITSDAKEIRP